MVVDDTRVPRELLSQGLYIQSLFLLKSSERHMTSQELVSEGLVYGCSETVNETFCLYIFTSAFLWFRRSQVLASTKDRSRSLMRPSFDDLQTCSTICNTFTYSYLLQHYTKTKRIRELNAKILLIHFTHLNKKTKEFCQRKEYLWAPISNVWLQKGHVLLMSRPGWSSNIILITSHFLLF